MSHSRDQEAYRVFEGTSLVESFLATVDEMHRQRRLDDQSAQHVRTLFQQALVRHLEEFAKNPEKLSVKFEGNLDMYRFCGNTWTLDLKDPRFVFADPARPRLNRALPDATVLAREAPHNIKQVLASSSSSSSSSSSASGSGSSSAS